MHDTQQGYNSLASHQALLPQILIFRRFSVLYAHNLLSLQAQIIELEGQLHTAIQNDRRSGDEERMAFAFDFCTMMEFKQSFNDASKTQKKVYLKLRPLLKEYGEALLLTQKLRELIPATQSDLTALREVLLERRGGHSFLRGREFYTWGKDNEYDLISLSSRKERDAVTSGIDWFLLKVFHRYRGYKTMPRLQFPPGWTPEYSPPLTDYSEKALSSFVDLLSTIFAPVLTSMSALCLYLINDPLKQMGIVVLSSFLFSTTLALIGRPKRTESFVATATFTAVLVVFVGSNSGG